MHSAEKTGFVSGSIVSDPRHQAIFDNAFEFYGTLDDSGRVTALTGRLFDRTGTNTNLLVGQLFSETVFWQSSENTARLVDKAVADSAVGKRSDLIVDFRVSADEKVPVELRLQPLKSVDAADEIFIFALSIPGSESGGHYDTEKEQLLRAAQSAGIGLWYWDIQDSKIYATASCNELLDLPAHDQITFESFLAVVHPEDKLIVEALVQRLQTQSIAYKEEFRVIRSDGSLEWISAEGKSVGERERVPTRMTGIIRNVTQQKVAAGELAKVYDREKRARDEAVEANRAKDFFLAFVSHELRSPLNAILGWSKILLTKTVDEPTRKNALETIERSARLQTKLINDLVDSARVASGKLRLEFHPTNVCEIVRVAYQAQKPVAETHNLEFTFASECDEVIVFGDAGRLQQVFTNLISNAIKFTPDGGKIWIGVKSTAETVAVHVRDTGHGIDPAALPNIFRQFSQGEIGRSRSNTGLGLGLSIVKILVNKHGGTVGAFSQGLGKGSEFVVTLPLTDSKLRDDTSAAEETASSASRRSLSGKTILLVEDDPDSREVLQLFLEQSGARVLSADSSAVAMEILTTSLSALPDLIISDLAMPEEDGYSLMARIREMKPERGGEIPAIALSAFTTLESKQKAFECGFQLYSTKPFDPDKLVSDIIKLTAESKS
ncbi:MAG TPA: ATP-binding protein [Pyrinomonadaceae bacterium]|nr:ATP-binding protein [Pyrinomonadaceae bacterium]